MCTRLRRLWVWQSVALGAVVRVEQLPVVMISSSCSVWHPGLASVSISCCARRTPNPRIVAPCHLASLRISSPCSRSVSCSATMPQQVQPHEVEAFAPGPPTTDIYAGISTIPISAALIGSGVDAHELHGDVCSLTDRPDKKQVHFKLRVSGFRVSGTRVTKIFSFTNGALVVYHNKVEATLESNEFLN